MSRVYFHNSRFHRNTFSEYGRITYATEIRRSSQSHHTRSSTSQLVHRFPRSTIRIHVQHHHHHEEHEHRHVPPNGTDSSITTSSAIVSPILTSHPGSHLQIYT